MASEPKTKPTGASVAEHLAAIEPPQRQVDALRAEAILREVTREEPVMWGPTIVGFGAYKGPTGDWPIAGFAARRAELVFYILPGFEERVDLMARLGRHRIGKSCLYIRKLADVDEGVLRELLAWSVETMRERHPA